MVEYTKLVIETRKAARQFAMLYFHICRTLYESLGEETAYEMIGKMVFELAIDRSDQMRIKAQAQGLDYSLDSFEKVGDLAIDAWSGYTKELGSVLCPYAEVFLGYYEEYPWFRRFASLYCDVIDTTNIENFSRTLSHKLHKNLVLGDSSCERIYFESDDVKKGIYTYGKKK
jgi:hypothetical protein